ncbi:hypothetical protein H257_17195, partial [Aphanomyces astaci]
MSYYFNQLITRTRDLHETHHCSNSSFQLSLDSAIDSAAKDSPDSELEPSLELASASSIENFTRVKAATVDLLAHKGRLVTGSASQPGDVGIQSGPGVRDGFVYECELAVESPSVYRVVKYVYRPDKRYANSKRVFEAVVLNACGKSGYDLSVRRYVTEMSFVLRSMLCQSRNYLDDMSVSLLLCDPELSHVSSLNRGKIRDATDMDPDSRVTLLKRLNTGGIRTAIFRGKVEDFFSSKAVVNY